MSCVSLAVRSHQRAVGKVRVWPTAKYLPLIQPRLRERSVRWLFADKFRQVIFSHVWSNDGNNRVITGVVDVHARVYRSRSAKVHRPIAPRLRSAAVTFRRGYVTPRLRSARLRSARMHHVETVRDLIVRWTQRNYRIIYLSRTTIEEVVYMLGLLLPKWIS